MASFCHCCIRDRLFRATRDISLCGPFPLRGHTPDLVSLYPCAPPRMNALCSTSTRPRLLGYAGAPFLASVPCLVLSVITIHRITTVSRMRKPPIGRQERAARLSPIRITAEERVVTRLEHERRAQGLLVRLTSTHSHEKQTDRISVVSLPHSISDSTWLPWQPTANDAAVSDASHVLPGSCSGLQQYSLSQLERASSPSPLPSPPFHRAGTPPSPITFAPLYRTPAVSHRPSFDPDPLQCHEHGPMPVSEFEYDEPTSPNTEQELVVHRVRGPSQPPQTTGERDKVEDTAYGPWPPTLTGLSARCCWDDLSYSILTYSSSESKRRFIDTLV